MSSDCFYGRVKSVSGNELMLDVLTGTAGGLDDLATSRSFALLMLNDAMRRAGDCLYRIEDEDARRKEANRMREKGAQSALALELEKADRDWFVSKKWMQANVGRFVESCALVERRNDVGEDALSAREVAIEKEFGALYTDQYHRWQPRRWQDCHNFTLRITVTDPKWLAHVEPGVEFSTTAYDVWIE